MSSDAASLQKCQALDSQGRLGESINLLTECIKHTASASLYFERGWRLEETEQYALAKDDYSHAIEIEPTARYLIARGLLFSARFSDNEAAMRDFRAAMTFEARNPLVHINVALCHLLLGEQQDAIECAKAATALAPEDPQTHSVLGQCLLAARRPADATEELRLATSLEPHSAEPWNLLARALRMSKKFTEAGSCVERAIELVGLPRYTINYARLLLDMNNPSGAISLLHAIRNRQLTEAESCLVDGYLEVASRMQASEQEARPDAVGPVT